MKESSKKDIESINESVRNIYGLLDELHERLVVVSNIINLEVKSINSKIESGEANKGLSREDMAVRRYILNLADKIQFVLRGADCG